MPETEAAKVTRLRQRKTLLERERRAEVKRSKQLDPVVIEEKRLKQERQQQKIASKEQKATVEASKKRERQEEKARLQQQKKDEQAAKVYARGEPRRKKSRERMRAARAAAAAWEAQLARLVGYKAGHGDCKVPQRWAEDPALGEWVSTQRKCKRKLDRGEPGQGMTAERAARLTALGFAWEPKSSADEIENMSAAAAPKKRRPKRTRASRQGAAPKPSPAYAKAMNDGFDQGC
jgi:hypothetical protein